MEDGKKIFIFIFFHLLSFHRWINILFLSFTFDCISDIWIYVFIILDFSLGIAKNKRFKRQYLAVCICELIQIFLIKSNKGGKQKKFLEQVYFYPRWYRVKSMQVSVSSSQKSPAKVYSKVNSLVIGLMWCDVMGMKRIYWKLRMCGWRWVDTTRPVAWTRVRASHCCQLNIAAWYKKPRKPQSSHGSSVAK